MSANQGVPELSQELKEFIVKDRSEEIEYSKQSDNGENNGQAGFD